MAIVRNIFPLELLNKITKHLDLSALKRLMGSSEVLQKIIERDPVIWKQHLKNKETVCSNGNYLAAVRSECILTQNWMRNIGNQINPVVHMPNVEITKITVYGDIVVISSNSTCVYVVDKSLNHIRTLNKHKGCVWTFEYVNNVLVTGSTDRTAKIWDVFLGVCIKTLAEHTSTVRTLLIAEEYVITGSRDSTIRVWCMKTGACKHVLAGHTGSIRDLARVPGKPYIISGSYDGSSILWNYKTGEGIKVLIKLPRRVYKVVSMGKLVAIAGMDHCLHVVTLEGKHVFSGCSQNGTIFQIKTDSEGHVYTFTVAGIFSKWSVKSAQQIYQVETNVKGVDMYIINHLVVVGLGNKIDLFCKDTGRFIRTLAIMDMLYSMYCDNNMMVYGYKDNRVSKVAAIRFNLP
ncbi:F-box and WD-40 domain protein 7 [Nematocida major]|uniref:F-box and WD-40 domain protein 7 n=1 Tax=Nematocida major TaxID=1912982 RepID=UPI002008660B|nr:F-box and WD-40 domain protein 7 [Nematocida major]KAH9386152.1 F-box and WD-40 domain protein 7 [Nematocida major]